MEQAQAERTVRRHRKPRPGDGTAWLVADVEHGDYLCYWYTGRKDGRLVEHARAATATGAVAWGRLRTNRVRIRPFDACTYWAGSAAKPEGLNHTWPEPEGTEALGRGASSC
jgi:hypothetical protein